jgi:HPt (histidine-containing phosphotransfer) domain-containing protein
MKPTHVKPDFLQSRYNRQFLRPCSTKSISDVCNLQFIESIFPWSTVMNTEFVYSSLADDPDFSDLVEKFVQKIPHRISEMETHLQSHNWQLLARTAHQLKGASGSYGFETLTPYAEHLETAAKEAQPEDQILAAFKELLDFCRRLRAGAPHTKVRDFSDVRCETP